MYNCEKCKILQGTPAIAATNLTITLPNVSLLSNRDILRFYIAGTIDRTNPLGTVSIIINGQTILLKTKLGNDVRNQQLVARRVYTVQLGAQTPNFTMLSCLPETTYVYPTYAPTTTTTGD